MSWFPPKIKLHPIDIETNLPIMSLESWCHSVVTTEFFGEFSQMIAFSCFFKTFKDPIEMTYFEQAPTNFTPKNLGSAIVKGIEMEVRKNLSFVHQKLKYFSFNVNASLIESRLSLSESELKLRTNGLRNGETIGTYRKLQGQAPFLINLGLNYLNTDKGIQTGLFYNVQGKTLEVVGTGFFPDVFTLPFHTLNFNLNKTFGKTKRSTLNLSINNILNDIKESIFESYGTIPIHFKLRKPQRTISLGYKHIF